jgi:hypothetical protein
MPVWAAAAAAIIIIGKMSIFVFIYVSFLLNNLIDTTNIKPEDEGNMKTGKCKKRSFPVK